MRSLVSLVLIAACSHSSSTTTPRGSWQGTDALANVPADTPYLFATLDTLPDIVRKRMTVYTDAMIEPKLTEVASIPLDERMQMPPWRRALLGIMDAARGADVTKYWENLGLKRGGKLMIYGLGIWPVMRAEVSDANKLRAVIGDAVKTLNMPIIQQKEEAGVAYWTASKDGVSAIVSVTDHDVVAAIVPAASLTELVPIVLGTKPVAKSLRDSSVLTSITGAHHLSMAALGYIDTHDVVAAFERKDAMGTTSLFTAPACHADYTRIADQVPRMVFGYHRLDDKGFDGEFAFETTPEVAKQLGSLHTAMPTPPDLAHALLAFTVAGDLDGGITVVRGWLQALKDKPFECEQLGLSKMLVEMGLEATKSLIPPELHGIKGGAVVIDDAHENPPGGSGYGIVAGDQIAMTISQAIQKLGVGSMAVAPDGQPVPLPVALLGMDWLRSAHLAMHPARVAVAVGDHSQTEVTAALGAPNAAHSPFAFLSWDLARFIKQMPSMLKGDNATNLSSMSTMMMTLDVRDQSVVIDVAGTWVK